MSDWRDKINQYASEFDLMSRFCRSYWVMDPLDILHWIDADPKAIEADGDKVEAAGKKYEALALSLTDELSDVDHYWTGVAAEKFTDEYMPKLKGYIDAMKERCDTQRDIAYRIAGLIKETQDKVFDTFWEAIVAVGGAVGLGAALAAPTGGVSFVLGVIAAAVIAAAGLVMMLIDDISLLYDLDGEAEFKGVDTVELKLPRFSTSGWTVDPSVVS